MDKRKKIFRRNAQFLGNLLASVTRRSLRGHFNDLRSLLIRVDKEATGVSLIERKLIMQSERARIWKDFRA